MKIDKKSVDELVAKYLPSQNNALFDEMNYSAFGGSRLRPLLLLQTVEALGGKINENAERLAVALELVHSYSLVHDDLPCMDNDEYRRGKLTTHAKFGETKAVLCGDALLNCAAEVLFGGDFSQKCYAECCKTLFDASSSTGGMIAGQVMDLFPSEQTAEYFSKTDALKTGKLFSVATKIGGILAGESVQNVELLERMGMQLGVTYQLYDDLCDLDGDGLNLAKIVSEQNAKQLLIDGISNVLQCAVSLGQCYEMPILNLIINKIHTIL